MEQQIKGNGIRDVLDCLLSVCPQPPCTVRFLAPFACSSFITGTVHMHTVSEWVTRLLISHETAPCVRHRTALWLCVDRLQNRNQQRRRPFLCTRIASVLTGHAQLQFHDRSPLTNPANYQLLPQLSLFKSTERSSKCRETERRRQETSSSSSTWRCCATHGSCMRATAEQGPSVSRRIGIFTFDLFRRTVLKNAQKFIKGSPNFGLV